MSVIESWERYVHCLFCNAMATLKPTKTRRIMLRCNTCNALIFANGIISQQRIQTLRDFVFRPLLWLLFQWSALNAFKFDDHHWHIVCWCIHIDYQLPVLTLVTVHVLVSPSFMPPTQSGEKLTVYWCPVFIVIGLVSVTPYGPAAIELQLLIHSLESSCRNDSNTRISR